MKQNMLTRNRTATVGYKNDTPSQNGHISTKNVDITPDMSAHLPQKVSVGKASIDAYSPLVGEKVIDELKAIAAPVKGARVLHLNSTAYGGGVAEILRSNVPLLQDLGIEADWMVIQGDDPFFHVTKAFHNALQGGEYQLSPKAKKAYLATNSRNSSFPYESYDYIVVHDPQPAAICSMNGSSQPKWVWRCHIDTANPNPSVWQFLSPYVNAYDAMVFTAAQYVADGLPSEKIHLSPPAIDPLSPKNTYLSPELCKKILSFVGVDTSRPLVTQVSRFDPWKDPVGVIEVYRQVKKQVPGLQLAMLGHLAMDDPQGIQMFEETKNAANNDPDIHMFTNFTAVSSIEVNAFQRSSDVVIQKSIREGFGLVVAEAQWKASPVVAGRAGGIPMQLQDGRGGYLVDSIEECAEKVLHLLQNPEKAKKMGAKGRQYIRDNYLTPRLLSDELTMFRSL